MKPIVFDIETIKNSRADKFFEQKTDYKVGNRKDPEKVESYIKECQEKDREKAALHWATGKIVTIGIYDALINAGQCWSGDNEIDILHGFFSYLDRVAMERGGGVFLSGKQTENFDIPYTIGRAMRHNIGIQHLLRPPNERVIRDVDHIFGMRSSASQTGSLSKYAWGLKLAPKTASGADVAGMVAAGDWDTLEEYCLQDCKIPAEMIARYNKVYIAQGA